jgi:hypothetical protein
MTDLSALADTLNEFVSTERSYVKRLRTLKEVRSILFMALHGIDNYTRLMRIL